MSTPKFQQSFRAGLGAVLVQVARDEAFRKHLTKAAATLATGVAIAMTSAHDAKAEENGVVRTAKNTIGAIIGGVIGNQFGGGNGKTAATVAGAAAGVWATEALSGNTNQQRQQPQLGSSMANGPSFTFGNNVPATAYGNVPSARQQYAALPSGTVSLSADRRAKLENTEQVFLAHRDVLARALYASEQAHDDLALEPRSKAAQQRSVAADAVSRSAQKLYGQAKDEFVSMVVYIGNRGYDVHDFAHSHGLANYAVTARDMSRNDMGQAAMQSQLSTNQEGQIHAERLGE
jgi:outer membrane lipoprotein SlyB